MKLADKKCSDGGDVPALKTLRARELLKELGHGWRINGKGHLERLYTFKDFSQAQVFANEVLPGSAPYCSSVARDSCLRSINSGALACIRNAIS